MSIIERRTVFVPSEKILVNENELRVRLAHCPLENVPNLEEYKSSLNKVISYRFCYLLTDIKKSENGFIDLGFGGFSSRSLCKNLEGCSRAYILAATTGIGVDRLLSRLSVTSPAKQFVTDALASASIEALCDYAEEMLCKQLEHKPRFSPGYGDLSVELQPELLRMLDAEKQIGITLTNALLMTPTKSVTAIIGVKNK